MTARSLLPFAIKAIRQATEELEMSYMDLHSERKMEGNHG